DIERSGDFKVGDLCRMADYFAVSMEAMAIRMEALKLIPAGSWNEISEARIPARELRAEIGITSDFELDLTDDYPQRYKLLAVQAFENEKITEGQLARLLRCSRIQAREIVGECLKTSADSDGSQTMVSLSLSHSLLANSAG